MALLRKFADEEDDPEEKLDPTIRYLQNLDERFIEVILENAHWVLREDPKKGMEVSRATMVPFDKTREEERADCCFDFLCFFHPSHLDFHCRYW